LDDERRAGGDGERPPPLIVPPPHCPELLILNAELPERLPASIVSVFVVAVPTV